MPGSDSRSLVSLLPVPGRRKQDTIPGKPRTLCRGRRAAAQTRRAEETPESSSLVQEAAARGQGAMLLDPSLFSPALVLGPFHWDRALSRLGQDARGLAEPGEPSWRGLRRRELTPSPGHSPLHELFQNIKQPE